MGERVCGKVAWTYLGTVIGAGFASGQELLQFFVPYGFRGVMGALLAGLVLGWAGGDLLRATGGRQGYHDLLASLLGPRAGRLLAGWMNLFFFLGLSIMFAAGGTLFRLQLGLPFWLGTCLSWLTVVVTVLGRARGIMAFNSLLAPPLCAAVLLLSLAGLVARAPADLPFPSPNPLTGGNWALAALLYASYNLVLGAAVLTGLRVDVRKGRQGAWAGGLMLGILAALAVQALLLNPGVLDREIPFLGFASRYRAGGLAFALVLWAAILTTAVADAFGLAGDLERRGHTWAWSVLAPTLLALPLAAVGFQQLVAGVYPLLGYAGLPLLGGLAWRSVHRPGG